MSNNQGLPPIVLPYFVANFNGRATTVKRDNNYQTIIQSLKKSLPELQSADPQNITISAKLPDYSDALVQIAEETWTDLADSVKAVNVALNTRVEAKSTFFSQSYWNTGDGVAPATSSPTKSTAAAVVGSRSPRDVSHQIKSYRGSSGSVGKQIYASSYQFSVMLRKDSQTFPLGQIQALYYVNNVKYLVMAEYGPLETLQRFYLDGRLLDDNEPVTQAGIDEGSVLDLELSTRQTVIYLVTRPNSTNITTQKMKIDLVLNRAWELVALAPSIDRNYKGFNQATSWEVRLDNDGTLWDSRANTKIECLFWDGFGKPGGIFTYKTKAPSEPTHSGDWLKSVTTVEPDNSVVVGISEVEACMSSILSDIGPEAVSNFLGRFIRELKSRSSTHFAIRALSSVDSEALARLSIDPAPEKTTRVVLLYKCLDDSEAPIWKESSSSLEVEPTDLSHESKHKEEEDRVETFRVCEITWLEVP